MPSSAAGRRAWCGARPSTRFRPRRLPRRITQAGAPLIRRGGPGKRLRFYWDRRGRRPLWRLLRAQRKARCTAPEQAVGLDEPLRSTHACAAVGPVERLGIDPHRTTAGIDLRSTRRASQVRRRLPAGGNWIRTIGPSRGLSPIRAVGAETDAARAWAMPAGGLPVASTMTSTPDRRRPRRHATSLVRAMRAASQPTFWQAAAGSLGIEIGNDRHFQPGHRRRLVRKHSPGLASADQPNPHRLPGGGGKR
jgi:hypothetical protein